MYVNCEDVYFLEKKITKKGGKGGRTILITDLMKLEKWVIFLALIASVETPRSIS